MNDRALRSDLLLLCTSCIWGFAFAAQRQGMEHVGPFLFNGVRFLLASASLLPLILFLRSRRRAAARDGGAAVPVADPVAPASAGRLFAAGLALGVLLFGGASLQQLGLVYTTAGKAGFITGLYVVLVPIAGIALRHRTGVPTWVGAGLAAVGLYFLSAADGLGSVNPGDLYVAASAVFWTAHVLAIDYFCRRYDPAVLSALQFAWCGLFSLAVAFAFEPVALSGLAAAAVPILYGGLCSVGIGYTLQVFAQKYAPPAHASIIMSLEGVFAVLGGWLVLGEGLTPRGFLGCALMLAGMIATQWDVLTARGRG